MYFGKDINIVVAYQLFKRINQKSNNKDMISEDSMKAMFKKSLFNLKYMGFISATRQSMFIFKKNFFGKPSHRSDSLAMIGDQAN